MKRLLQILVVFITIFIATFIFNNSVLYAQTPTPSGIAGEIEVLSNISSCSTAQVSITVSSRLIQGIADADVYLSTISNPSYSLLIDFCDGPCGPSNVVSSYRLTNDVQIYDCTGNLPTICPLGQTANLGSHSAPGGLSNYPSGQVGIRVIPYFIIRDRTQILDGGAIPLITGCTLNQPLPTTQICNPAIGGCGAGGRCRPTETCNASGQCVFDPISSCNYCTDYNLTCGGGGCPPGYVCYNTGIGLTGYQCDYRPTVCLSCTDTSGTCGANGQCNLFELN